MTVRCDVCDRPFELWEPDDRRRYARAYFLHRGRIPDETARLCRPCYADGADLLDHHDIDLHADVTDQSASGTCSCGRTFGKRHAWRGTIPDPHATASTDRLIVAWTGKSVVLADWRCHVLARAALENVDHEETTDAMP